MRRVEGHGGCGVPRALWAAPAVVASVVVVFWIPAVAGMTSGWGLRGRWWWAAVVQVRGRCNGRAPQPVVPAQAATQCSGCLGTGCGVSRAFWRAPAVVASAVAVFWIPAFAGLTRGRGLRGRWWWALRMFCCWCSPPRSLQALSAAMLESRMISISSVISSWRARLLRRARSSSCSSMRWRACSMCSRRSWFSCSSAS